MRILIVDDEIHVAKLLAESVQREGHEAITASSGTEGLALVEQMRPDAVFLDIVMPEMSGLEVLRELRQRFPHLPVVVITGHAGPEQIDEARDLGAVDCISKPFILNRLHEALRSIQGGAP